mgnify:CR=1 FL=1
MEISRDGHRARMRAAYLQGGGDAMPDHQLLELLLSISIPRKDVKPIAYALINRFGSLEQVFAAGAADLQQVPGVGEQTAVQILLVRDLNRRIHQNQNKPVKHLTDATQSCAYFANLLRDKTAEQVYLVTLDGSAKILQTHAVGSGRRAHTWLRSSLVPVSAYCFVIADSFPKPYAAGSLNDISHRHCLKMSIKRAGSQSATLLSVDY